jgi:hypothetical protein
MRANTLLACYRVSKDPKRNTPILIDTYSGIEIGESINARHYEIMSIWLDGEKYDAVINSDSAMLALTAQAIPEKEGAIYGEFLIFALSDRLVWRNLRSEDVERIKNSTMKGKLYYSL